MANYGHHVHRMLAKPVTGDCLRLYLMAMRPSSMGLDGWSLQDLRVLPHRALEWLP